MNIRSSLISCVLIVVFTVVLTQVLECAPVNQSSGKDTSHVSQNNEIYEQIQDLPSSVQKENTYGQVERSKFARSHRQIPLQNGMQTTVNNLRNVNSEKTAMTLSSIVKSLRKVVHSNSDLKPKRKSVLYSVPKWLLCSIRSNKHNISYNMCMFEKQNFSRVENKDSLWSKSEQLKSSMFVDEVDGRKYLTNGIYAPRNALKLDSYENLNVLNNTKTNVQQVIPQTWIRTKRGIVKEAQDSGSYHHPGRKKPKVKSGSGHSITTVKNNTFGDAWRNRSHFEVHTLNYTQYRALVDRLEKARSKDPMWAMLCVMLVLIIMAWASWACGMCILVDRSKYIHVDIHQDYHNCEVYDVLKATKRFLPMFKKHRYRKLREKDLADGQSDTSEEELFSYPTRR